MDDCKMQLRRDEQNTGPCLSFSFCNLTDVLETAAATASHNNLTASPIAHRAWLCSITFTAIQLQILRLENKHRAAHRLTVRLWRARGAGTMPPKAGPC